ncbi:hypothetical protein IJJ39_02325 [Candidatus Saccharibacteria bacterium]|nr:hypothetical protein [Candidatus Saccharibacteria bacterium]
MKRTKKNLLGALGLCVVAATTIYAATLPAPGASATTSVTDTIKIRVVTEDPEVTIGSSLGDKVTAPEYSLDLGYANVSLVTLTATRLDAYGEVISGPTQLWQIDADFDQGESTVPVNFNNLGGYGKYIFTISGRDVNGITIDRSYEVVYTNVNADIKFDDEGNVSIIVTPPSTEITKVDIVVRDDEGNEVATDSVDNPGGQVTLPLDGLPAGDYEADLTYYDKDGNVIGSETIRVTKSEDDETIIVKVPSEDFKPVDKTVIEIWKDGVKVGEIEVPQGGGEVRIPIEDYGTGSYEVIVKYYDKDGNLIGIGSSFTFYVDRIPNAGAPDTGGLFHNLDISRADYLATGLIVFFVFAVVALGVVMRSRKTTKSSKKRR